MTRASAQRIARRAETFGFQMPPAGMLSEQIDLEAYELVLGLIHPDDSPLMVAVWDGERMRRLLPEHASTWADELIAEGQAVPLAPVIEAIRTLVRRVGDIVTDVIMRQMEVEGRA